MKLSKENILKNIKENKYVHYCILIIIALIITIPFINKELSNTHDGICHILRVVGTAEELEQGQQTIPMLIYKYCNSSGYAVNLFYPLFVTYMPLLFKLFTSSYTFALQLFGIVMTAISGITMYNLVKEITKKKWIALFAGIIYLISPYKLSNLYVRYAIGEFTALAFIPKYHFLCVLIYAHGCTCQVYYARYNIHGE